MPNMFARRLGTNNRLECRQGYYCPQVLEKTDGTFVVVGKLVTQEASDALPPGPGIGPNEGAVEVPRAIMLSAMADYLATAA
jgi:hypothetical protein